VRAFHLPSHSSVYTPKNSFFSRTETIHIFRCNQICFILCYYVAREWTYREQIDRLVIQTLEVVGKFMNILLKKTFLYEKGYVKVLLILKCEMKYFRKLMFLLEIDFDFSLKVYLVIFYILKFFLQPSKKFGCSCPFLIPNFYIFYHQKTAIKIIHRLSVDEVNVNKMHIMWINLSNCSHKKFPVHQI
jgi:hypothetical protein